MVQTIMKQYLDEVNKRVITASQEIPAQRIAFKQGYSFSKEPFEKQLHIWHYIWKNATIFRTQLQAYFFLEQYAKKKDYHKIIWQTSIDWQEDVNDWPLSDSLSKINTYALVSYPAEVYKQLAAWNKDKNPWKRRQSLVSLLYYSRTKKDHLPFDKITALITPRLKDPEYYVQKGLGWTLREVYNVYPKETMQYFKTHIKNISATAFTAAVEKLSIAEKDVLKELRKLN